MATSKIEWTESTWNFVTGCDKISTGCKHCYAETFSKRLLAMGHPKYAGGFDLTIHRDVISIPLKWKKPKLIFVNSMSDLFHENVPLEIIRDSFDVMTRAYWHQFQILTKRADRLLQLDNKIKWTKNIWMGVSVENSNYVSRIEKLKQTNAMVKFLSLEPLLGPLPNLDLRGIDWVIVGGESGFQCRPIKMEWVVEIRDQCIAARVPFFFKQWGGVNKKKSGRMLEGRTWDQFPDNSQANQMLSQLKRSLL